MKYCLALGLTFIACMAMAQESGTYRADLRRLRSILEKTPSYKDQVNGEKRKAYDALYVRLESDSSHPVNSHPYFINLAQLFFPLQDNHLGFYQLGGAAGKPDQQGLHLDIDSLRQVLATKSPDSVEGIYYYGNFYTMGLVRTGLKEYTGLVLDSKVAHWQKGEIAAYLFETRPNYFRAIYLHPRTKNLMLYQLEKYAYQSLVNAYFYQSFSEEIYTKSRQQTDFVNLSGQEPPFQFRNLRTDIQYMHLKNFSADQRAMKESQAFHDSVKPLLRAPILILDLRNNEGGADKVSKKYLALMKDYTRNHRVYVLINNGTMSQGEIFALQLRKLRNVTLLGQTTRGALVYGSNYGKRERLPSGQFEIYITDMRGKGGRKLVPYENIGVAPDQLLSEKEDWIEQTIRLVQLRTGTAL